LISGEERVKPLSDDLLHMAIERSQKWL